MEGRGGGGGEGCTCILVAADAVLQWNVFRIGSTSVLMNNLVCLCVCVCCVLCVCCVCVCVCVCLYVCVSGYVMCMSVVCHVICSTLALDNGQLIYLQSSIHCSSLSFVDIVGLLG